MSRPLAIFDIDGTFIRSALLIEFFRGLVRHGVFPEDAYKDFAAEERAWIERRGTYERYILAVVGAFYRRIAGCDVGAVARIGEAIAEEQCQQVYVFTRRFVEAHRASHALVAITGSPQEVVQPFLSARGFAAVYPSVLEVRDGHYTGERTQNPATEKRALVDRALTDLDATLVGSVGVGDTEADVGFLERVERQIAFNPNRHLRRIACARKWEIVVERKDDIVRLLPDGRYEHIDD